MDKAFDASRGAKDNQVFLADFRAKLGGTRESQDAAIRQGVRDGKFSLDTHEGLHETTYYRENRDRLRAGSLSQGNRGDTKPYMYISRR